MSLLPRMSLTQMVIGSVAVVVATKIARPLLVEVVRAGFWVKDVASEGYGVAKSEIDKVAADARTPHSKQGLTAEISQLQAQVQALQAQLAAKKA
jgi:hypothetical protein